MPSTWTLAAERAPTSLPAPPATPTHSTWAWTPSPSASLTRRSASRRGDLKRPRPPAQRGSLTRLFAPGELASITLNFPTPFPKRKFARKRLVHVDQLIGYRPLLRSGGTVTLRTDSQPLRDYALAQFEGAGYEPIWVSDDVRAEHPSFPVTEYEQRLAARGAAVYGICAAPRAGGIDPELAERARAAEQSLVAYLPQDLDALDYVPLGMEGFVLNARNREAKGKRRVPQP